MIFWKTPIGKACVRVSRVEDIWITRQYFITVLIFIIVLGQ
jgi:hypothetical protein